MGRRSARPVCAQKIFRTTMLFQFVNVLLQVLLRKSHDLLQEEIGVAVYNMASVDFDGFFAAFLPEFLSSCDGVDANQKNVLGRNFKMDRVRRQARLKGGQAWALTLAPTQGGRGRPLRVWSVPTDGSRMTWCCG